MLKIWRVVCVIAFSQIELGYGRIHQATNDNINYTLNCSDSCNGDVIICPSNASCHIICDGDYSCFQTSIKWPNTQIGTIYCNGKESCSHTNFPIPPSNINYTFICDDKYECKQSIINCPIHGNCNIICNQFYSCWYSIINCPINGICNIKCSKQSCQHATIDWSHNFNDNKIHCMDTFSCIDVNFPIPPPNIDYTIYCNEPYKCHGVIIECPTNANCNIICNAKHSCQESKINWPVNGIGNISCHGFWSCQGTNFPVPSPNKDFTYICKEHACINSMIFCPMNANCDIICNGKFSCQYATINWPINQSVNSILICNGSNACIATSRPPIYPIDDKQDFYLNCNENSQCANTIIHCPLYAQCHISCIGKYSCFNTIFKWRENYEYSLECNNEQFSCGMINYTPYNNNEPLIIECNGNFVCFLSVINCPTNSKCIINCNGPYSCLQATFNGFGNIFCNGYGSCLNTKFPIPPSNEDFQLICNVTDQCRDATIYCPSNANCYILCIADYFMY